MDRVGPGIDEGGRSAVGPDEGLCRAIAAFVRRHRDGDDRAMSALARSATPWLIGLARRQGLRRAAAEDVAQTTLHVDARAFRRGGGLAGRLLEFDQNAVRASAGTAGRRQPTQETITATSTEPTSTIAPSTCRKSGQNGRL